VPADCEIEDCGVLAVGRCQTCTRPFCTTHQARVSPGSPSHNALYIDLCAGCQAEQRRRAADQVTSRQDAERARLRAIDDPYERLAEALRSLCEVVNPSTGNIYAGSNWEVLADACPDFFPAGSVACDLNDDPPWNGHKVAEWFVARASKAGLSPNSWWAQTTQGRTMLGRPKVSLGPREPVWGFRLSTFQTVRVFPDGHFMQDHHQGVLSMRENLPGVVLVQMIALLR
jgi:hypothetical protein